MNAPIVVTPKRVHRARRLEVWHASHRDLFDIVGRVHTLIVDPPYSAKTHAGHDAGVVASDRVARFAKRQADSKHIRYAQRKVAAGTAHRRALGYAAWTDDDVGDFVERWAPKTSGWFVAMTDHVLWPSWERYLARAGRYVFAPIPYVAPGSRVRLGGDGPSNWTIQLVIARPCTRFYARWGTTPGAYILPSGEGDRFEDRGSRSFAGKPPRKNGYDVVGGKPVWLYRELLSDYSQPGMTAIDPCAGGLTLARAGAELGLRDIICGDIDRAAIDLGLARLRGAR